MRDGRRKAWWGGGLAAVVLSAAAYGLAPEPPQLGILESARTQQKVLREIDAETYAPAEFEAYRLALHNAAGELAAQRDKFYYSRQYLTFARLSHLAVEASGSAERAARENRAALQRDVVKNSREISSMISDIRYRINRVGISNTNRARLVRADVLVREAELLGQSNDWHDANEKMAAAIALVRPAEIEQQRRLGRFTSADLLKQWDRWVRETIAWSAGNSARAVVVVKAHNVCILLQGGKVLRSYAADLGKNGIFDKSFRGDEATPEGKYKIIKKKSLGHSKYYKALLINYPNDEDIRMFRRARTLGHLSLQSKLGGLIEIHGDGGRDQNWTQGCVALSNADMDDIFARVDPGTPVTIVGNFSDFTRVFGHLKTRGDLSAGQSPLTLTER